MANDFASGLGTEKTNECRCAALSYLLVPPYLLISCSTLSMPCRLSLGIGRIPPRERDRLAERVLIDGAQRDAGTSSAPPRTRLGRKRRGMLTHDFLLLLWCELDHPEWVSGMQGRKNALVHAEVRVPHVRTLNSALHGQRNAAEVIRLHQR